MLQEQEGNERRVRNVYAGLVRRQCKKELRLGKYRLIVSGNTVSEKIVLDKMGLENIDTGGVDQYTRRKGWSVGNKVLKQSGCEIEKRVLYENLGTWSKRVLRHQYKMNKTFIV
jgi:hypothetical protein